MNRLMLLICALPAIVGCYAGSWEHNKNQRSQDECLYNQDAFEKMYEELKEKYSRATVEDGALVIPFDGSNIVVWYGGCEHYVTKIAYFSLGTHSAYSDKEIFEKAVNLVTLFGQGRVDPGEFAAALDGGNFQEVAQGVFLVPYPAMDWLSIDSGEGRITVHFWN